MKYISILFAELFHKNFSSIVRNKLQLLSMFYTAQELSWSTVNKEIGLLWQHLTVKLFLFDTFHTYNHL